MEFFTFHMPPFLSVMGVLYIIVAAPVLINLLRDGYWNGVFRAIRNLLRSHYLLALISVLLILSSILWVDLPLTKSLKELDNITHSYTFWDFICSCAEGGFVSGVLFTLVLLAGHFKCSRFMVTCQISLMSSIYSGLANGILKFLFNRERPSINLDPWHFFAFFESGAKHFGDLMYAYNSMPSGHTITTVAAILPFYMVYKKPLVRALLITWVVLVAFARIYTINHWLSDVVIAALFGVLIGFALFKVNQRRLVDNEI